MFTLPTLPRPASQAGRDTVAALSLLRRAAPDLAAPFAKTLPTLLLPMGFIAVGLLVADTSPVTAVVVALSFGAALTVVAAFVTAFQRVREDRVADERTSARTLHATIQLLTIDDINDADGGAELTLAATGWKLGELDDDGRTVCETSFPEMSQVNLRVAPEGVEPLRAAMAAGEFGVLTSFSHLGDRSQTTFKLAFPSVTYEVAPPRPMA